MARKKKRLPKDFDSTLRSGDLDAMRAAFETTELDAHQGAYGPTALGMYDIPPELVAWLVAQGADVDAPDHYGHTPLWQHAHIGNDPVVTALLDAGADLHPVRRQALGAAAQGHRPSTVRLLLERGADPLALEDGRTALETGLSYCSNIDLPRMADVAEVLLAAGTPVSERMRRRVEDLAGLRSPASRSRTRRGDQAGFHLQPGQRRRRRQPAQRVGRAVGAGQSGPAADTGTGL